MKSKRTKLLLFGLIVSGFGAAVASAENGSTKTNVNEQSIEGYHNVALNRGGDYPKASASSEYNPLFFGAHKKYFFGTFIHWSIFWCARNKKDSPIDGRDE